MPRPVGHSRIGDPRALSLAAVLSLFASWAPAEPPPAPSPEAAEALGTMLSGLIRQAIPLEYEKQEDWGATKEIPIGVRITGKPLHRHYHRQTKSVEHGVWKHYKLRMIDPQQNLAVRLQDFAGLPGGRAAFTLLVDAKLDAWGRAKIFEYGIHLGAYELEADATIRLAIRGDVGVRVGLQGDSTALIVDPRITEARLAIDEFHLRRISNADGPLVRQLGDGVRRAIEEELDGERLTAKLNRAIDKKRDRLVLTTSDLPGSDWFSR